MQSRFRFNKTILVPVGNIDLSGELIIPEDASSLVLFSHGSGSSRFSPRNNFVATQFHEQNIGTFLFDLLTKEEDEVYANRFNIELLTNRLIQVTKFISYLPQFSDLDIGYFGASTGAASALKAAAVLPDIVHSIVSRGGRPDLAIDVAPKIKVPTLLIVGGKDYDVLEMNKEVLNVLRCEKKLEIVKNATHLFEEPGTLAEVALLAAGWFKKYLKNTEKELAQV
jgi:pimeloyl-ACP methyl ester carboxylesterase